MTGLTKTLRVLPLAALLCGCESKLTVDVTDGPVDSAEQVVLAVASVKLLTEDDDLVTLSLDDSTPFDLLSFRNGVTHRLVSSNEVDDDHYVGIALSFSSSGSYVLRDDGGQVTIDTPGSLEFTDIDLDVGSDDDAELVLDVNLRFSLIDTNTGTYDLVPVVRAVRPSQAGSVAGAVDDSIVESDSCRDGRAVGTGVAVYVFKGNDVTPADYIGQSNLIDAADVGFDTSTGLYRYEVHNLVEGDYTLALTCEADQEDPASDDGLDFIDSGNASIDAGEVATLDFP